MRNKPGQTRRLPGAGRDVSIPAGLLEYHGGMVILRVVLHAAIFVAAFLIFTLGLGVGLAFNPAVGMLLWLVAGLVAGGNVVWIVRGRRRSGQSRRVDS